MFCPKCNDEFIEGIKECPDCKVSLVEEPVPEPEAVYVELVTVLESGDSGVIMIAKSLLEEAGIKYYAKGETSQHLFGLGTLGTGFNTLVGPIRLQVSRDHADEAAMLLKDLAKE